eukprot:9440294-Lingulodinium_polyedra.AAC.1
MHRDSDRGVAEDPRIPGDSDTGAPLARPVASGIFGCLGCSWMKQSILPLNLYLPLALSQKGREKPDTGEMWRKKGPHPTP